MGEGNDQDRFRNLLDDLSASRFQITPEQRVRALTLYIMLGLDGVPKRGKRLPNLIGPLLCRSAEEQAAFHRIFRSWFPEESEAQSDRDDPPKPKPLLFHPVDEPVEYVGEEEPEINWFMRIVGHKLVRWIVLPVCILLLILVGVGLVTHRTASRLPFSLRHAPSHSRSTTAPVGRSVQSPPANQTIQSATGSTTSPQESKAREEPSNTTQKEQNLPAKPTGQSTIANQAATHAIVPESDNVFSKTWKWLVTKLGLA